MPNSYGFNERMEMSEDGDLHGILLANVPDAVQVVRSSGEDDRAGTDYWVERSNGEKLSVDVKVRSEDWAAKAPPKRADDLALETWSVVERNIVGWTRNASKRTDYILWFWQDTGR